MFLLNRLSKLKKILFISFLKLLKLLSSLRDSWDFSTYTYIVIIQFANG